MKLGAKPIKVLVVGAFVCVLFLSQQRALGSCIANERQALRSFRMSLTSYLPISWQSSSEDCCRWEGVECSNETTGISHVVSIRIGQPDFPTYGSFNRSLLELSYLEHLDLGSTNPFGKIPPFLGSLQNLRYLDLSDTKVSGQIPVELGNLFRLEYLNLSGNSYANVQNLKWLSNMTSLQYLDLSVLNLSKANDWLEVVTGLPNLRVLRLSGCDLPDPQISSSLVSNSRSTLESLELQGNRLTDSIFPWLFKHSQTLSFVSVSNNRLKGLVPEAFGTDTKLLQVLDLSHNQLQGVLPKSFGSLCGLKEFSMAGNRVSGELGTFVETLSECSPNISLLKTLDLSDNMLNGAIPEVIGNFSELVTLYLGGNSLKGLIFESHFSNLSKLKNLNLSSNSLALSFSEHWVPSFQLDNIRLSSIDIGPQFPTWLQTQKNYSNLDVSNTSISGAIPNWIWNGVSSQSCQINLSRNRLSGKIQNLSISFVSAPEINLGSNQLEGLIPTFLSGVASLDLSNNSFSGTIDFLCSGRPEATAFDLSNNQLSGVLPNCWSRFSGSLLILDLANNHFSGKIPSEIGWLINIKALQLRNNNFSGDLPESLKGCLNLEVLDLGGNHFSGQIPEWIGNSLPNLIVLSLRLNHFSGPITSLLCHLTRIQIFDLSGNDISKEIPDCLNNLTALTVQGERNSNATIRINYLSGFGSQTTYKTWHDAESSVSWRGRVYEYKREMNLGYMKCIDLSNNKLTGKIPDGVTELRGLVSLNLSRNSLTGEIPRDVGNLGELNVLDLSRNRLSGEIPVSLSQIDRLGMLDLSNNGLSGRIPTGTQLQGFPTLTYEGNLGLCGAPLKDCDTTTSKDDNNYGGSLTSEPGFYLCAGIGYTVGIWVVLGTLMFNQAFRVKYFAAITAAYDWLYVKVAVACRTRTE